MSPPKTLRTFLLKEIWKRKEENLKVFYTPTYHRHSETKNTQEKKKKKKKSCIQIK